MNFEQLLYLVDYVILSSLVRDLTTTLKRKLCHTPTAYNNNNNNDNTNNSPRIATRTFFHRSHKNRDRKKPTQRVWRQVRRRSASIRRVLHGECNVNRPWLTFSVLAERAVKVFRGAMSTPTKYQWARHRGQVLGGAGRPLGTRKRPSKRVTRRPDEGTRLQGTFGPSGGGGRKSRTRLVYPRPHRERRV